MNSETMNPATSPPRQAAGTQAPLDDLMLAMDVVDTLRRRERLAKRELDLAGREQDLKDRLRKIYHAQGIEVPDQVLEQGVAALKEGRFVYQPPADSLAVKLARIYVSRGRWGKWLIGGIAAVIIAWALNYFLVVAPDAALPNQLAEQYQQTIAVAQTPEAQRRATQLFDSGKTAAQSGDTDAARQALTALESLQTILTQEYSLRIVNRPDEQTGVWRIPNINSDARNYYIIVEAIDPSGRILEVPIANEETGKTDMVTAWGLRVDQQTFDQVARDKQDDGIIERNQFGEKARGALTPDYKMRTTGGAITQW